MPRCANCSSFDPYYKNGWCDEPKKRVSPSDSCSKSDYNGSHEEYDSKKTCSTCTSFDPYTRGGYCDYHKCTTNSSSYCISYT